MLDAEQIANWERDNADALQAAAEYVRRAEKGLPADRLCDGAVGARLVAKGIHAQQVIMALQADALAALAAELQDRGADAMDLHSEDSPYHGR